MSLSITGKLIGYTQVQQLSSGFQKRDFVIEIQEEHNGSVYTNYGKFQLAQARVDLIEGYHKGDLLEIHFNIRGKEYEKDGKNNYITNLDCWKIVPKSQFGVTQQPQQGGNNRQPAPPQQSWMSSGPAQPDYSNSYAGSDNNGAPDDLPF